MYFDPVLLAEQREILLSMQETLAAMMNSCDKIKASCDAIREICSTPCSESAKSSTNSVVVDTSLEVLDAHLDDSSIKEEDYISIGSPALDAQSDSIDKHSKASMVIPISVTNLSGDNEDCLLQEELRSPESKLILQGTEFSKLYCLYAFEWEEKGTSHTHQVFEEMPQRSLCKCFNVFGRDLNFETWCFDPGILWCSGNPSAVVVVTGEFIRESMVTSHIDFVVHISNSVKCILTEVVSYSVCNSKNDDEHQWQFFKFNTLPRAALLVFPAELLDTTKVFSVSSIAVCLLLDMVQTRVQGRNYPCTIVTDGMQNMISEVRLPPFIPIYKDIFWCDESLIAAQSIAWVVLLHIAWVYASEVRPSIKQISSSDARCYTEKARAVCASQPPACITAGIEISVCEGPNRGVPNDTVPSNGWRLASSKGNYASVVIPLMGNPRCKLSVQKQWIVKHGWRPGILWCHTNVLQVVSYIQGTSMLELAFGPGKMRNNCYSSHSLGVFEQQDRSGQNLYEHSLYYGQVYHVESTVLKGITNGTNYHLDGFSAVQIFVRLISLWFDRCAGFSNSNEIYVSWSGLDSDVVKAIGIYLSNSHAFGLMSSRKVHRSSMQPSSDLLHFVCIVAWWISQRQGIYKSVNDSYYSYIQDVLLAAISIVLKLQGSLFVVSSLVESLETLVQNSELQFFIKVYGLLSICFGTSYTQRYASVTSSGFSKCLAQYDCAVIIFPDQFRQAKSYPYDASDSSMTPCILISLLGHAMFGTRWFVFNFPTVRNNSGVVCLSELLGFTVITVQQLLARVAKLDVRSGISLEGRLVLNLISGCVYYQFLCGDAASILFIRHPSKFFILELVAIWTLIIAGILQTEHWSCYSVLYSDRKVLCCSVDGTISPQQYLIQVVVEYIGGVGIEVVHSTCFWDSTQQNPITIADIFSCLFILTQMAPLQSFGKSVLVILGFIRLFGWHLHSRCTHCNYKWNETLLASILPEACGYAAMVKAFHQYYHLQASSIILNREIKVPSSSVEEQRFISLRNFMVITWLIAWSRRHVGDTLKSISTGFYEFIFQSLISQIIRPSLAEQILVVVTKICGFYFQQNISVNTSSKDQCADSLHHGVVSPSPTVCQPFLWVIAWNLNYKDSWSYPVLTGSDTDWYIWSRAVGSVLYRIPKKLIINWSSNGYNQNIPKNLNSTHHHLYSRGQAVVSRLKARAHQMFLLCCFYCWYFIVQVQVKTSELSREDHKNGMHSFSNHADGFSPLLTWGQVISGCLVSLRDFGAHYYLTDLLARQFISMKFSGNAALYPAIFLDYSVVATGILVGYFSASSLDHLLNIPAAFVVFPVHKLVKLLYNSASIMFTRVTVPMMALNHTRSLIPSIESVSKFRAVSTYGLQIRRQFVLG